MVTIIDMSHHPRVKLPNETIAEGTMNAREFLIDLCETYAVDPAILLEKLVILVDGERLKQDTLVHDNSKIYILPAATMG